MRRRRTSYLHRGRTISLEKRFDSDEHAAENKFFGDMRVSIYTFFYRLQRGPVVGWTDVRETHIWRAALRTYDGFELKVHHSVPWRYNSTLARQGSSRLELDVCGQHILYISRA